MAAPVGVGGQNGGAGQALCFVTPPVSVAVGMYGTVRVMPWTCTGLPSTPRQVWFLLFRNWDGQRW
eukprot:COSAG01_NODE_2131_length_8361_cov_7.018276_7_plen_66_part_00